MNPETERRIQAELEKLHARFDELRDSLEAIDQIEVPVEGPLVWSPIPPPLPPEPTEERDNLGWWKVRWLRNNVQEACFELTWLRPNYRLEAHTRSQEGVPTFQTELRVKIVNGEVKIFSKDGKQEIIDMEFAGVVQFP